MLDHITFTVRDLSRSKGFYTQALAPLGYAIRADYGEICGIGPEGKPAFWLKAGPVPTSPTHLAFKSADRAAVDAFYAAALAAGATDNGPPGLRPDYHVHYYGAFVIDPDGHPIEAVCHRDPEAPARAAPRQAAPRKAGKATARKARGARKARKPAARKAPRRAKRR
jgi:catechol 2,3-dioxygenase-like lactoylglutathione lyase family enzyme